MPLKNFAKVELPEQSITGVKYPKTAALYRSAQPDGDGYDVLRALGVDIIYQLNGASDSRQWKGLLEVRDLGAFIGHEEEALGIVDEVETSLRIGRAVEVHCTYGRDRTGAIIGGHRIRWCGWSYEQMEKERLRFGPKYILEIGDQAIVRWLKDLAEDNVGN